MLPYLTIGKFAAESGYTEDAIRSKIARGDWLENKVWCYAPDNRILIIVQGYEAWVEQGQASAKPQKPASKFHSSTAACVAVKG